MTPPRRSKVTANEFEEIVDRIEERARRFLHREAQVGQSTRVSGAARIGRVELNKRLVRLRDHVGFCEAETSQYFNVGDRGLETRAWISVLNTAERIFQNQRIHRLQQKTIWKQLIQLLEALEETLSLLAVEVAHEAEKLAPDLALDLLTPEEYEAAFDDVSELSIMGQLLRTDQWLRAAHYEVMALIKGSYFGPIIKGGQYEKRRGRWIAAFLLGMAEGLGLQSTRNMSPHQHSQLHSAADAVAIVIGRLQAAMLTKKVGINTAECWQADPAALAVLRELPRNRWKNDFDPNATTENLIRKIVLSKAEYIAEARRVGRHIGDGESRKKA